MNLFEILVFSKPIYKSNGSLVRYTLQDGEILYDLSYAMNFTLNYVNTDLSLRGNQSVGLFTFYWLLKALETEKIDYSAMYRVMVELYTKNIAFLSPFHTLNAVCVVQYQPSISRIYPLFIRKLKFSVIMVHLLAVLLIIGLLYMDATVIDKRNDFFLHFINVQAILFGVSIKYSSYWSHQRLLIGITLFSLLIFGNTFQGKIVRQLSVFSYDQNIKTMQQLVESDTVLESVSTFINILKPSFKENNKSSSGLLYSKQFIGDDNTHEVTAHEICAGRKNKNVGFLTRKKFADYHKAMLYCTGKTQEKSVFKLYQNHQCHSIYRLVSQKLHHTLMLSMKIYYEYLSLDFYVKLIRY